LREFKRLDRQLRRFVVGTVEYLHLELDRGQPVAELGVLAGEGLLIDLLSQPQVEQPVLLGDDE
jgi:hypothetical protein